jgi:hypothetical protein
MSGLVGNPFLLTSAGAAGYQISRSLRFNSSDSAYCDRSFTSAGNRKTWTFAAWVKLSALTGTNSSGGGTLFHCRNGTGDDGITDFLINTDGTVVFTGGASTWLTTTQVLRDFSAWYHLVMSVDTTAATASNRLRLYINGSQVTTFNVNVSPTQNSDLAINQAATHRIGGRPSFSVFFNGYLADIHFIDGQALTPSSFTEVSATTGQLVPIAYTGSFGTNGFWLKFSDNSAATATTLGKDYSGNSNNWTPNNLSVSAGAGNDSLVDTPTSYGTDTGVGGEVRGNYATFNPVAAGLGTLSNGNLDVAAAGGHGTRNATIGVSSGKWYSEFNLPTAAVCGLGITSRNTAYATWPDNTAGNYWFYFDGGTKYFYPGGGTQATSIGAPATGIWKVALDLDSGKCWLGTGSIWYDSAWNQTGNPATGANPTFSSLPAATYFMFAETQIGTSWQANFGQRPWGQTCPSGFKALCDTNLPAPVVAKPNSVFDVALWTGNGSARSITGLNFNPDFVWIKGRSGATDHALYDAVRGATIDLVSNSTAAETTQTQGLTAFNSDGFSLGTLAKVNTNTATYAGWAWDAGSSTVTNTQGSITSQVRANASAGFSIVTYTGTGANATVGHGLGVTPSFIIVKSRSNTTDWQGYHGALGKDYTIQLMSTGAAINVSNYWNGGVSSTTFGINGAYDGINANGYTYVAYCFSPVAGYSSFGSYTGNGSADGPFVYTGHRVRWLLVKNATNGGSWVLHDTTRSTYNVSGQELLPDSSGAEYTFTRFDFLSNGFKGRSTNNASNTNGDIYIYAAFAENPFQYARAR